MADGAVPPPRSPDSNSIAQIQESAKWLVATLGAIAAILVAGLSLANLGDLADGRLVAALVGTAAATIGVVWLLSGTLAVLVVRPVTLDDLEDDRGHRLDATVLSPASSPADLAQGVRERVETSHTAYAAHLQDLGNDELRSRFKRADAEAQLWLHAATKAHQRVRLNEVRDAFEQVRSQLWLKSMLVLAGVAVAAWGLTGPQSQDLAIGAVEQVPVEVLVQFEDGAADGDLAEVLGEECVSSEVAHDAVALDAVGQEYSLVIHDSDVCTERVVRVGPGDARVAISPQD